MQNNKNDWMSFDKDRKIYTYYQSNITGQIEYNGSFEYIKDNQYKIKDGFFENYTVEVHDKYIVLKNDSISERWNKKSDMPGYIKSE